MGVGGKVALTAVGLVLAVTVVVAVRTVTFKAPAVVDPASVKLATARPVDVNKVAGHLAQAVRFQTISHQDRAEDQPAEWDKLHAWLQTTYPEAHKVMTREVVAEHTLVYTWPGSNPALPPIVLMAHQDVVPVTPGSEGAWTHPPFDGVVADGAVWGRGSIDDKGSLVTLFEAIDAVAASGFKPVRTLILVSGHDEEVRGVGARAAAALLKSRNIKAQFVLDEGMAVVADHPVTGQPAAIIGTAEKGYGTLKVVAPAVGGHSSAPPADGGGVVTLAKAVQAIDAHQAPMKFQGPGADMLKAIAPHASPVVKVFAANTWLFAPLLVKVTAKTPAGAAMLHTTIAPTMLKGSPKENVLPQDATAWINYRIAPGDSSAKVMARAKDAVGKLPVELSWTKTDEPSPISSTSSDAWKTLAGLAADESKAPVVPGLVTAGTDSRYLTGVASDVYRFQPLVLKVDETKIIHGTDEHISLDNVGRMVRFYQRLVETAASR
jgi:carboxypeptidase PM20D1